MSNATPQGVSVINMYAPREEIYAREVTGRYASLRWVCMWLTQVVFYGLPWLVWNGRQAVLFDLAARKFSLFGLVLWPQDFIYLALLLVICAYSLFLFTAVAGRVWCGFACPQTVYTEIFMWIERKLEGRRSARIRLDKQAWSLEKFARKGGKHAIWAALALWTGFTFVGYFTPIRVLLNEVGGLTLGAWECFWVAFYAFATYGNAGWMREQVCKYMCPYARFQSSMFDKDTLIVTYDKERSDCINCTICVQACPVGIDIRQGLQYECIGCAACIDACNDVMAKIKAPLGLIRYSTERAIAGRWTNQQILQRVLRPRVMAYSGLLILIVSVFLVALVMRTPLKLDVIRDRGTMGRELSDGVIENVYRLQIMNTAETPHRYRITVSGIESIALATPDEVDMEASGSRGLPVRVQAAHGKASPGSNRIVFKLQALDDERLQVQENAVFFVPK